jgi:bacterioferritin (cytochrome b1)
MARLASAREEAHLDWLEAQLDQIARMGIQTFLSEQSG